MSTLEQIKNIRDRTGAGVVDVKKALDEAEGDEVKALEILKKRGQSKALKKSGREVKEGVIGSYIHTNGKLGVMVKVFCETDFVARNEDFLMFAKDIAMHIAAADPQYLEPEEVSADAIEKEKILWREQLINEGKPENMIDTILAGKEKKYREEVSLMTQPFVKDPSKVVRDVAVELISRIGENVQIGAFKRFDL